MGRVLQVPCPLVGASSSTMGSPPPVLGAWKATHGLPQPLALLALDSGWAESETGSSFWSTGRAQARLAAELDAAREQHVDAFEDDKGGWQRSPPPSPPPHFRVLPPSPSPLPSPSPPSPQPPPPSLRHRARQQERQQPSPSPPIKKFVQQEMQQPPSPPPTKKVGPPAAASPSEPLDPEQVPLRLLVLQIVNVVMSATLLTLVALGSISIVVAVRS